MLAGLTRRAFGDILHAASPSVTEHAIDEYWKGFEGPERRAAHLALYRSGDFTRWRATRARSPGSTSRP
jgi:hypothetical protein